MRIVLTVLAALMITSVGCVPTEGNSLDWQEKSLRKVTANVPRYGDERVAFTVQADANGLAGDGVIQQFPVKVNGFPEMATVSFRSLKEFRAEVWFRGFDPKKLVINQASLVDNRGHIFKLYRTSHPSYGSAAELAVDRAQNANWMEFNNREYFLTLAINFTYDGQPLSANFPKVYCAFTKPGN
jgi:hypothetical protein